MTRARAYSHELALRAVAAQREDRHSAILAWQRWSDAVRAAKEADETRTELEVLEVLLEQAAIALDWGRYCTISDEIASL